MAREGWPPLGARSVERRRARQRQVLNGVHAWIRERAQRSIDPWPPKVPDDARLVALIETRMRELADEEIGKCASLLARMTGAEKASALGSFLSFNTLFDRGSFHGDSVMERSLSSVRAEMRVAADEALRDLEDEPLAENLWRLVVLLIWAEFLEGSLSESTPNGEMADVG